MTRQTKLTVIDLLQFVKVSVTHNGEPSNIQQSGHLTALSCKMLVGALERSGYRIVAHGGPHGEIMIDHLKHMATVRPDLDGEATRWALAEIERLRAQVRLMGGCCDAQEHGQIGCFCFKKFSD